MTKILFVLQKINGKEMRNLEFEIMKVFDEFGFEEVRLPMVSSGEVREDFTTEIVKRFGYGKFCYRGGVFRISPFGKPEEMYQLGCEIVAKESISYDDISLCAQVLNSVLEHVRRLVGGEIQVVVGHYGLVKNIFGDLSDVFFKKNITKINEVVKSGKVDKRYAFAFFKVFSHQDEVSAFFDLPQDILIFSEKISCKKLFNLSESAEKDYYTGVIFGIFLNKKRIGFGGKYSILKKEGIGFSINLLDIFS